MLADQFTRTDIKNMHLPVKEYHPFPVYAERERWETVSGWRAEWVLAAEAYLDYEWPAITAQMYLRLKTDGQLKPHWDRFRERRSGLGILAIAECMEGKGRFLHQIINGIVAICEETTWLQPLGMKRFDYELPTAEDREVDLTSSETASLLAWIDYLLGAELDGITRRIRPRIRENIKTRILSPYLDRDDYWWMGFTDDRINNWNPWCNMNVIMCALLLEDDPDIRTDVLYKVMRSLDRYVDTYAPDGCCDEGPMYWGAAGGGLFICLELLEQASGGRINVYGHEKLRLIGQYITKAHIHEKYYVNYADGDARVTVDSGVYRFGKAIGDRGMMGLGSTAETLPPRVYEWFRVNQYLHELFTEEERRCCNEKPDYPADAWFWHTGVMTAREQGGSAKGFFVSAKAGNNIESHNHNDIGNFVVYYDGKPLLIDIGTEEYSAKTFSAERYDIWYIQSQYHNCPGINGVVQHDGREFRAEDVRYMSDPVSSTLEMELRHAYPEEAGILSWRRSVRLTRSDEGSEVTVEDKFSLREATDQVYRYLITPCAPLIQKGLITFNCGEAKITAQVEEDAVIAAEEIAITESRLNGNWGDRLYRIVIRESRACDQGTRLITIKA